MGRKTEEFYVCDCCGKERIDPVRGGEHGPVRYTAKIHEDVGVTGGRIIDWTDLCNDCHYHLAKAASALRSYQQEARAAARAALEGE